LCFVFLFFYFFTQLFSSYLSNRLSFLDVVLVEILLEVEVGELLSFRNLEELAERSVRLDVMLDFEVVGLYIVVEFLGDIGAGDEGACRLTEEAAEFIRNLGRDFEDGRTTLGTFFTFSTHAAFTTASIFDFTVNTLIKTLDFSDHGRDGVTEGNEGGEDGLDVIIKSGGRSSRSSISGSGSRSGYRSRSRSSSNRSRSGSSLATSLLGFSNRGYRSSNNRSNRSDRSIFSLLSNTLGLSGGGSSSGVHYTSTVGRIHLK
jgi:hypothetical protein